MGQLSEKKYKIIICDGVSTLENEKNELVAMVKMTKNSMFPLGLQIEMVFSFTALAIV